MGGHLGIHLGGQLGMHWRPIRSLLEGFIFKFFWGHLREDLGNAFESGFEGPNGGSFRVHVNGSLTSALGVRGGTFHVFHQWIAPCMHP